MKYKKKSLNIVAAGIAIARKSYSVQMSLDIYFVNLSNLVLFQQNDVGDGAVNVDCHVNRHY